MAEESITLDSLERNICVARKELNNLRQEVNSLKRMFIQKIKEVKGFVEKGTFSTIAAMLFAENTQRTRHFFPSRKNFCGTALFSVGIECL